ncbi:MAG: exosortase/archaeosortase family protein [Acidimicrobiales bacterium]
MTAAAAAPGPPGQLELLWQRARFPMLLLAVGVAYHQSLSSLLRGVMMDTPLAYLGLVPIVAAGLALVLARRPDPGPPIHDRQLDYIIGLPLLFGALAANLVLPGQLDTKYWLWRLDLLTLPFFVAGASFLLFGTRVTWKVRGAILFLFAAWPYPYTEALFRWTNAFTLLTIRSLAWCLQYVPWATHNASGDGSKFDIVHQGTEFTVQVASQCSGANSLVGFLLIGSAFVMVVRGPRPGKLAWLLIGASITWLLNVFRIMLLFGIGRRWGERVAIDAFHPFIGLVLLNVGLVALIIAMPLFRLSRPPRPGYVAPLAKAVAPMQWASARQVVISFAALLGVLNSGITQYGLVASEMGVPRLAAFTARPATLPQWPSPQQTNTYEWTRRFFGNDSTWTRFSMASAPLGTAALTSSVPITADVIATSSLARLETYGVEACYDFHGYDVSGKVEVDLGGGVRGTYLASQKDAASMPYSAMFWHWPVVENGKRRFERVTLLLPQDARTSAPVGNTVDSSGSSGDLVATEAGGNGADRTTTEHRDFLVQVARSIVQRQPTAEIEI